jgi:hypothetical protein
MVYQFMTAELPPAAARLCAACGMCCNGDLFHSVELQPGDFPRALSAAGLKIKRKAGREYFLQPCPAYQECRCAIYDRRPARCRLFKCRQLLRVTADESAESSALEMIGEARILVARVNALISLLAETNPNRALAKRCANALTTSDWTPLHDELQSTMHALETLLDREFRP